MWQFPTAWTWCWESPFACLKNLSAISCALEPDNKEKYAFVKRVCILDYDNSEHAQTNTLFYAILSRLRDKQREDFFLKCPEILFSVTCATNAGFILVRWWHHFSWEKNDWSAYNLRRNESITKYGYKKKRIPGCWSPFYHMTRSSLEITW